MCVSGCLPLLLAELPESTVSEPQFPPSDQDRTGMIITFYLPHKNASKINLHVALISPGIKEFKALGDYYGMPECFKAP